MDQKRIRILVILVFFREMTSGAGEDMIAKEGQSVEINCKPQETGTMVVWFRVLDSSGMEFIASFSNNGVLKSPKASFPDIFRHSNSRPDILTLVSFNKARDAGVYNCASLFKGTELKFGRPTRLLGVQVAVPAPQPTAARKDPCTTATPCVCNINTKQIETSPQMFCSLIILGPLAGGCGLLLLLLIITILYCNRIRTRRCPHHYKRKQRMAAPGNQKMTNRHI
ncbi:T-cell surface glycoprotein CD8 alpha chain [Plectropomus leopardus]|uniref:T-cell surface glycoprotein CD8 alpha chain n=1 Tax=Plectropomus leopardus TaxID=160734 RepID=UPI001C4AF022|nr:T-cell surface glycoprotein CD8 alpha chain [Plectropomus leopardus]